MACFEKLKHPDCGSSDGLQVFLNNDDTFSGYCFACDSYVPDPYGEEGARPVPKRKQKTEQEIAAEIEEITGYPCYDLPLRKLRVESLSYFGVRMAVSEQDGRTPIIRYFPFTRDGNIVSYKAKLMAEKKMWIVGSHKGVDFFGWQQAISTGAKKLYITEGEEDAVALYQALKDYNSDPQYADFHPAVVSLPSGASSAKAVLADRLSDIRAHFKEIILCFDMDDAGRGAAQECIGILPGAKGVQLPAKDANACVIEGRSKALAQAVLFKAAAPKNTRIVNATELYEAAKEPPTYGLSWPWPSMTKLTRGIRFGETLYLGAGVKMGKSEVVNTLAAHLICEHNLPVLLAKPEEANKKTIKMVLGKVAGRFFHDPDKEFDQDAYDKAAKLVGDRLNLINLYQDMGWDNLRVDIHDAVANYGVKAVFIDPITNLTNGTGAGETNTILQEIAQSLAAIALDLDIVIFIFCHLKAPNSGEPHERGGEVQSYQFAGSRAMMRSCNYMIGLEGDKSPELAPKQRNMRNLVVLEDREFGEVDSIKLYWNPENGLFNEVHE